MVAPGLRGFTRRGETLLHWSKRFAENPQPFLLDLKSGESRLLAEPAGMDPATLTLSPDDRTVVYFDSGVLREVTVLSLASRDLYHPPEGVTASHMTMGFDGAVFFVESRAGKNTVKRISRTQKGTVPGNVATFESGVDLLLARPRIGQLLYRAGGALSIMNADGSAKRPLKVAEGTVQSVAWTPTGRSFIYLHVPEDPKQLITLREYSIADSTDKELARTSQFDSVAANADASVFVGASRSKASSYVLILLRVTKRELTLCEHHAGDPDMVDPVFSPDSQSVFFNSDRHGKPAIYRIRVDYFVEQTEG
jgi:Tol biopolymer transport system component